MILVQDKYIIVPQKLPIGLPRLHNGKEYTVLPWNLKIYSYLVKLKLEGIPDILKDYDYPYDWASVPSDRPYNHQIATTQLLVAHKKVFCWNDTGTGKTASCLWAYDWLRKRGEVKKILIICPKSPVKAVWAQEIFKVMPWLKYSCLLGEKKRRLKELWRNLDCYIVNHDGIKLLSKELVEWGPDIIIADESTAFKSISTSRSRILRFIAKKVDRVWLLSGTPAPQGPVDLYAQALLVCPERVGRSLRGFRDLVMTQVDMFRWVPKEGWEKIVEELIQPVIRFKREDCLDLPPVTKQIYSVDFSPQQVRTFNLLRREAVARLDEGAITAVNEGVMRNKLLQCCGGLVYGEKDGERCVIDLLPAARMEAVRDIIQESARGVLIFVPYRHAIDALEKSLTTTGWKSIRVITGDTSMNNRTRYFAEFQKGEIDVLIAHPKTMGHGLTLTYADTVIWYIVTSDNELYEQANSRINRIGQDHKMLVVHLVSTELERSVLTRLEQKRSMQGLLLETFKGEKKK